MKCRICNATNNTKLVKNSKCYIQNFRFSLSKFYNFITEESSGNFGKHVNYHHGNQTSCLIDTDKPKNFALFSFSKMKANTEQDPPTSADINKQMLEIKKKIQLSGKKI